MATQHLDMIISINLLTQHINNTNLLTNTTITIWSIIEQFALMTTKNNIMNKDSSIVVTTEDLMTKATMNLKEITAKLIMLAMKDKLSITKDSLINTTIAVLNLLHKDIGIDDILEPESEVNQLRNTIEQATRNIISDNTKILTNHKDEDNKRITTKVRCI